MAILRIIYLVALNSTDDYTWTAIDCWVWSVLEPSLAVVVACGPTLAPLIAAILGRIPKTISLPKQYVISASYPRGQQPFTHISDSEYPLQPRCGNFSTVDPTPSKTWGDVSGISKPEQTLGAENMCPSIMVQKDIMVNRSV